MSNEAKVVKANESELSALASAAAEFGFTQRNTSVTIGKGKLESVEYGLIVAGGCAGQTAKTIIERLNKRRTANGAAPLQLSNSRISEILNGKAIPSSAIAAVREAYALYGKKCDDTGKLIA